MKLYLYGGIALLIIALGAYVVHKIKDDVRDEIKIETANTAAKVQGVKDEVRSKPVTGNDVINSLSSGTW